MSIRETREIIFKIISVKAKGIRRKHQVQNGLPNLAVANEVCDEIFTFMQRTGSLPCPAVLYEVFHVPQNT